MQNKFQWILQLLTLFNSPKLIIKIFKHPPRILHFKQQILLWLFHHQIWLQATHKMVQAIHNSLHTLQIFLQDTIKTILQSTIQIILQATIQIIHQASIQIILQATIQMPRANNINKIILLEIFKIMFESINSLII